jgi:hypothetical protein
MCVRKPRCSSRFRASRITVLSQSRASLRAIRYRHANASWRTSRVGVPVFASNTWTILSRCTRRRTRRRLDVKRVGPPGHSERPEVPDKIRRAEEPDSAARLECERRLVHPQVIAASDGHELGKRSASRPASLWSVASASKAGKSIPWSLRCAMLILILFLLSSMLLRLSPSRCRGDDCRAAASTCRWSRVPRPQSRGTTWT